jgi:hypothetical protein
MKSMPHSAKPSYGFEKLTVLGEEVERVVPENRVARRADMRARKRKAARSAIAQDRRRQRQRAKVERLQRRVKRMSMRRMEQLAARAKARKAAEAHVPTREELEDVFRPEEEA